MKLSGVNRADGIALVSHECASLPHGSRYAALMIHNSSDKYENPWREGREEEEGIENVYKIRDDSFPFDVAFHL